jgi:hypothetical protein
LKTLLLLAVFCLGVVSCSRETDRVWSFSPDLNDNLYRILQDKINVDYDDCAIEDAVVDIRQKSGINIIMVPEVMANGVAPVTLHLRNVRVGTVLDALSRTTGIDVRIMDDIVYLYYSGLISK